MKNWYEKHMASRDLGARVSDDVAKGMGSWRFIIIQTVIVIIWMVLNTLWFVYHWDVYPFILLNLLFSTQAAYAAPIIMMAQNRAAERDKMQAEHQYETQEKELKINTDLTQTIHDLTEEIHKAIVNKDQA